MEKVRHFSSQLLNLLATVFIFTEIENGRTTDYHLVGLLGSTMLQLNSLMREAVYIIKSILVP